MSVLSCDRLGCEDIMCDHLIDSSYYICTDCIAECKEWLKRKNKQFQTEDELKQHFIKFITEKRKGTLNHRNSQDWDIFDEFVNKKIYIR